MSWHVFCPAGKLEWASHDLSTIFIQRKNMFSPTFLRMVMDVIRFGREAPQVSTVSQLDIGTLLEPSAMQY